MTRAPVIKPYAATVRRTSSFAFIDAGAWMTFPPQSLTITHPIIASTGAAIAAHCRVIRLDKSFFLHVFSLRVHGFFLRVFSLRVHKNDYMAFIQLQYILV